MNSRCRRWLGPIQCRAFNVDSNTDHLMRSQHAVRAVRDAATGADIARVAAISAMTNRTLRNLEITECYADLSDAVRARTGALANWCTFATWASRQAGSTIRGEDLIDRFERRLGRRKWLAAPLQSLNRVLLRRGLLQPDTRLGRIAAAIHTPLDAFERASEAVAAGNLKVFEEIGREFARYLTRVPADATTDSEQFRTFTASLRPGPPPDGQDYLAEAFAHYQRQRHDPDPASRAAAVLLANLQIGLHEQTRLQPQIAAAVDAPLVTAADLGARVLHALIPGSRRWPALLHRATVSVLGRIALTVRRTAVQITREVVTESMMVLALPGVVLALGRNLDAPVPAIFQGTPPAPLRNFLQEHDPCAGANGDCGANDWCDLKQRMHYILHLFRAYGEDATLFSRPFTSEQVARFRGGVVPLGDL